MFEGVELLLLLGYAGQGAVLLHQQQGTPVYWGRRLNTGTNPNRKYHVDEAYAPGGGRMAATKILSCWMHSPRRIYGVLAGLLMSFRT